MTDRRRFPGLNSKEQRGSKPRCHLLTHGSDSEIAQRLTALCGGFGRVRAEDRWMPRGFDEVGECQLHRRSRVLDSELCEALSAWWLPPGQRKGRTPNFDIAATCTVDKQPGLLLIEAKAHVNELVHESSGRSPVARAKAESQGDRLASHRSIGAAIEQARAGLSTSSGLRFGISRDACYQMSNRFSFAWKLADAGIPVILVYLGFLDADDMADKSSPFRSAEEWEQQVREHAREVVPDEYWGKAWNVNGQVFVPLIQVLSVPLADQLETMQPTCAV